VKYAVAAAKPRVDRRIGRSKSAAFLSHALPSRSFQNFPNTEVLRVSIIAYLFSALIVLVRVYVPISMTFIGGWPARLAFTGFWFVAILTTGGSSLEQFFQKLKARWAEITCYALWVAVLLTHNTMLGGQEITTTFLLNAYIGTIPFYLLGTYYSIDGIRGRGMALATAAVVGISCLMAIPVVWQDPSLVRIGSMTMTAEGRASGIGSYSDLTGFAIILPFFLTASLQAKHVLRLLGLAGCLATIGLLMIATLTGLILLTCMAVAGCILYYLLLGGFHLRRIMLGLTAVLGVGLATVYLFPSVYERTDLKRFYDRLVNTFTNLPDILSGQVEDPTSRYALMINSLQVFLDNPVTGTGLDFGGEKESLGGHSSWMDALALYGLVGGVPCALFHLLVFRRLWKAWRRDRQNMMYWGCLLSCALYLFYGFFNVTTQGTTLALFLYATAAGGEPGKATAPRRSSVAVRPPQLRAEN
jgi:hypothetical protein